MTGRRLLIGSLALLVAVPYVELYELTRRE